MVQRETGAKGRQVTESYGRILSEASLQISGECLRPGRIPRKGQCKGRAVLHIQLLGKLKCRHRATPCRGCIPEQGFPQCGPGFKQSRSEERRVGKECRSRWS